MKRPARDLKRAHGLSLDPRERARLADALVRLYARRFTIAVLAELVLFVAGVLVVVL